MFSEFLDVTIYFKSAKTLLIASQCRASQGQRRNLQGVMEGSV